MSSYLPLHWKGLVLPAQTGGLRLTGPIPLNIANEIRVAAPEQISVGAADKQNFVYPIAVILRRMDFETLRLQASFQKEKAQSPGARNPDHFLLRIKAPDGAIHETTVEDLTKAPVKGAKAPAASAEASPFALDLDYAYQGVSVSEWEIERSRAGAQATTREYIFDLHPYFPAVEFGSGQFELQIETLGITSNWASTIVQPEA